MSAAVFGSALPATAFSADNHRPITQAAVTHDPQHPFAAGTTSLSNLLNAVVRSDSGDDEKLFGPAHCDNADYLSPRNNDNQPYIRSRGEATRELHACVRLAYERFVTAVGLADRLVDDSGAVIPDQSPDVKCTFTGTPGPAKCGVLESLGRSWHAVEDFYAHSNYADRDKGRPFSNGNPPGLHHVAPAPLLRFRDFTGQPHSPVESVDAFATFLNGLGLDDLATGCYAADVDSLGQPVTDCGPKQPRITHDDNTSSKYAGVPDGLAKDTDGYLRGEYSFNVGVTNFEQVRDQATAEIGWQWRDFQAALTDSYGAPRADAMLTVLTHDQG
ncbi:hypothetical protein ACIQUY_39690 [Streptomyces sp. NPDC090231]|uniref:hypothetical protein n=1 Tax=unclassified Streptomyces TaxID=2593676 RepID=UPI00382D547D